MRRATAAVTTMLAALAVVVWAARGATPEAGYLVTVVASQLVSPILWDHYAMLLLLPVAWLLERRQWWSVAVPVLQGPLVLNVVPPLVWLAGYAAVVLGVAWLGTRRPIAQRLIESRSLTPGRFPQ